MRGLQAERTRHKKIMANALECIRVLEVLVGVHRNLSKYFGLQNVDAEH